MLERILEAKRRELDDLPSVKVESLDRNERDFEAALRREGLSIIAEVKRRSPSAGALREAVDPVAQAAMYAEGGARAISVLVDREFFGGSWEDLAAVVEGVDLPVLCKEFVIDVRQVRRARRAGAARRPLGLSSCPNCPPPHHARRGGHPAIEKAGTGPACGRNGSAPAAS